MQNFKGQKLKNLWLLLFVVCAPMLVAHAARVKSTPVRLPIVPANSSFEDWLKAQTDVSVKKLFANISPKGSVPGAVIASPSRVNPDYYYHWVRDAALVQEVVVRMYGVAQGAERARLFRRLDDYIDFSRSNQLSKAITGIGEPKFYVNGLPYDLPWGRPQNDGPALRALTLTRYARLLLDEGDLGYVQTKLYDAQLPAYTVIKADLEYVSHHWRETSFDLWEEVRGHHFYTRIVQRASLLEGAELAHRLADEKAALWYQEQADEIAKDLHKYWDGKIIRATYGRDAGADYKDSGIDVAVVLGVLHAGWTDKEFGALDEKVMKTAYEIEAVFKKDYPINQGVSGTVIGRYPEDLYYGGHGWVLATAALAEYHYLLARKLPIFNQLKVTKQNLSFLQSLFSANKKVFRVGQVFKRSDPQFTVITQALRDKGDAFMTRIRQHGYPDGSLSEQIRKDNGFMESATDLTWSYASIITASAVR